ncbi:hypothetical protein Ocin01_11409 [Orchesella cincta]|uniref:Uncharacterized protein n=1 Tax=Orchesella cincta TaxID=48709 RepID=A0A1D2MQT4_ORCCI|nr:hypothetical protein Ocin01_11409 [Orchesella cincta]
MQRPAAEGGLSRKNPSAEASIPEVAAFIGSSVPWSHRKEQENNLNARHMALRPRPDFMHGYNRELLNSVPVLSSQ